MNMNIGGILGGIAGLLFPPLGIAGAAAGGLGGLLAGAALPAMGAGLGTLATGGDPKDALKAALMFGAGGAAGLGTGLQGALGMGGAGAGAGGVASAAATTGSAVDIAGAAAAEAAAAQAAAQVAALEAAGTTAATAAAETAAATAAAETAAAATAAETTGGGFLSKLVKPKNLLMMGGLAAASGLFNGGGSGGNDSEGGWDGAVDPRLFGAGEGDMVDPLTGRRYLTVGDRSAAMGASGSAWPTYNYARGGAVQPRGGAGQGSMPVQAGIPAIASSLQAMRQRGQSEYALQQHRPTMGQRGQSEYARNFTGRAHRNGLGGFIQGPGTGTSDSVPAQVMQNGRPVAKAALSDGEFVMTSDAVRGAGGGDRNRGAANMYRMMRRFERGGMV